MIKSTTKRNHWFSSMSANMQRAYVEKHPKTRFKATAGATRTAPKEAMESVARVTKYVKRLRGQTDYYVNKTGMDHAHARQAAHRALRVEHHGEKAVHHQIQASRHKKGSRWYKFHMNKAKLHKRQARKHQRVAWNLQDKHGRVRAVRGHL